MRKVCKSTLTKSYFNFEKIIISGENWPKIGHGITFLHMNKAENCVEKFENEFCSYHDF